MTNLRKLWHATSSLTTGDVHRHTISVSPLLDLALFSSTNCLFLKVTNTTSPIYNVVPLTGPYQFTVSCVDEHSQTIVPKFLSRIPCGNSWKIELSTAQQANAEQPGVAGRWRIELVSEVVFSKVKVSYEVELSLETTNHTPGSPSDEHTTTLSNSDSVVSSTIFSPSISHLKTTTTSDIFRPPPLPVPSLSPSKHHLVVLTHGLHGTQSDFLYLREAIENQYAAGEEDTDRVLVWTCDVNHTLTEHGIEAAGLRIAERLMVYLGWPWADAAPITHISFVGHSLGGLLNLFILGHLQRVSGGQFFLQIRPANFITLATPWCGSFELPWVAKQALALGTFGQTGKDLVLCRRRNDGIREGLATEEEEPILLAMARPDSYAHRALRMFERRTVYANTEWDITVGFRTSILWYCGMEGVGESEEVVRAGSEVEVDKTVDGLTSPLIHPPPASLPSQLHGLLRPNPIPDQWLLDPSAVPDPIIHDRVYVPSATKWKGISHSKFATIWKGKGHNKIEEEIARLWHSDMAFRKVCVRLHHNAHEGIVVRRRWVNAGGGWNVLAHLMREHAF